MNEPLKNRRPRGFAAMDPQKQKALASAGGRAAHQHGRAHQFTEVEARAAGAKGRAARQANRQSALAGTVPESATQPSEADTVDY